MRWRRGLLLAYLLLLVISQLTRWAASRQETPLSPGVQALTVSSVDVVRSGGARRVSIDADRSVRLAYRSWGAPDTARRAVLLLHGSPGDSGNFVGLGPLLAENAWVIAPDLPGFGDSTRRVPDYSIVAHARYVIDLLDALEVAEAHVVGFSMGGGVALHLQEMVPDRVASLVLLSAIGVQELELLGSYHVNHALHALQLGGLWLLQNAVPHFGAFDDWMLDVSYARNFFDTDQRPLRGSLRAFEPPLQIVHGDHDVLVPYAAAVEHHRLVPHSELVTLDANHFVVFRDPRALVGPIGDFVARVEAGTAPRRADALSARVQAAEGPSGKIPRAHGFAVVVVVILLAAATTVSEDLTCVAAGVLVAQGRLGFGAAVLGCFLGIFLSDLGLYVIGRWLGRPFLGRRPLSWIVSEKDIERSRDWFERRGALVIFVSRFLPGTRVPTYVSAGVLRMPFWWFTMLLVVPVAIWTPLLVGIAYLLGDRFLTSFEVFSRYAVVGLIGVMVTVWLALSLGRSLSSWKGRRLLLGWWRRQTQWEFWPRWRFYPPVVLYVLWLGLRHRSSTLFTAANPGIAAGGGLIGESKAAILEQLDPAWVAPFARVPAGEDLAARRRVVEDFLESRGLTLPVVLKPDVGERGDGVAIVRRPEDIDTFLVRTSGESIVQAYIEGPELGVFYVRLPGEENGRIFSITDKQLTTLTGDGVHDLDTLILRDARAVVMAPVYRARLTDRLNEVPAAGERVPLVDVGTHCRGAIFLDGSDLRTDALSAAIDRLSKSFDGFYFGRYDLRAPSLDAYREGRDWKVLELNGVSAEATHIYDPKHSLLDAYRVLFEQWRLAFEVGRRNRVRGTPVLSITDIVRLLRQWSRGAYTPPSHD